MAGKSVSFNTNSDLYESPLEYLARWLSCNGEVWGIGPTAVFASAAALFLYKELQATVFVAGDHVRVSLMEKTLVSSMVIGMMALMVHLWVCSMRFFQYYLDTLIRDSPSMLLEMTTAGLLGKTEMVPLGPLTRFLKQQQPQIHITVCWFLSLCYADYVRKHYCQRFNMPYLEQWQTELHARASHGVNSAVRKMNSFIGAVHQRLRGCTPQSTHSDRHTVRAVRCPRWRSVGCPVYAANEIRKDFRRTFALASSANPARLRLMRLRNSEHILRPRDVRAEVRRTPASVVLTPLRRTSPNSCLWRSMVAPL